MILKKISAAIFLLMISTFQLSASSSRNYEKGKDDQIEPHGMTDYRPGDMIAILGAGTGFNLSLALYPALEVIVETVNIAGKVPMAFGFTAKGYFNSWSYQPYLDYTLGSTIFGIGGFGTAHYSFKALDSGSKILNSLDAYLGIGIVFSGTTVYGTYTDWYRMTYSKDYSGVYGGGLGFASYIGLNYFITDHFGAFLEGNYWAYASGLTVGAFYRF